MFLKSYSWTDKRQRFVRPTKIAIQIPNSAFQYQNRDIDRDHRNMGMEEL